MGIILREKTKEKFGYYPEELKSSSEKIVVWKCENCDAEIDKKYRYALKNKLCLQCSNKVNANTNKEKRSKKLTEWFKTHEHPLKGTKRPEHVLRELEKGRKKSHELQKTEERRKEMSELMSGEKNRFFNKKHTKESLKKMSEASKKNARRGKKSNFYGKQYHGKGDWYICKDGAKVWMRSSWEIKFAKYLDKTDVLWLYEPKAFPIIYNKKEGTYTPDFYLIKENRYIEIKGWWRDDAYDKFESFNKQYLNLKIELYDKSKLKELKIL